MHACMQIATVLFYLSAFAEDSAEVGQENFITFFDSCEKEVAELVQAGHDVRQGRAGVLLCIWKCGGSLGLWE